MYDMFSYVESEIIFLLHVINYWFKRIEASILEIKSILHGLISVKAGIDVSSLFLWN